MPRMIITVMEKPALPNRGLLVRLIEEDDTRGYYLSCWSLPWPSWLRESPEQLEDYQAQNWKRDISTSEAEQWLESLRHQTIPIAPTPEENQARDGVYYDFIFEDGPRRIQLSWDNEIPESWRPVWPVTERLLELARAEHGANA